MLCSYIRSIMLSWFISSKYLVCIVCVSIIVDSLSAVLLCGGFMQRHRRIYRRGSVMGWTSFRGLAESTKQYTYIYIYRERERETPDAIDIHEKSRERSREVIAARTPKPRCNRSALSRDGFGAAFPTRPSVLSYLFSSSLSLLVVSLSHS